MCSATSVSRPRRRKSIPSPRLACCDTPLGETLEKPWSRGRFGRGMGWTIRLCGPVGLDQDGRSRAAALPGRQGRLLFAYLVLNRDRDCGRAELIDLLWPERPPAAADSALSALLSKLRRALGEGVLAGRSELRLVPPGPIDVDVEVAAAAAARAEAAIDANDWGASAAAAREVLGVDLQTFLPDCDGPWVAECRRELDTVRVRALEVAGRGRSAPGRPGARHRRAGRPRRRRRHAVPRVLAPAADGGPRGGRQPGRGAARVRGAADPAARRAGHHARAARDGRTRAAPARRGARPPRARAGRREGPRRRLARAAGRGARPPRAGRPRARARGARALLGRGGGRRAPARPAVRRCGHRQDAAGRGARPPRARRRRARALRALRRGDHRPVSAGGGDGPRLVRRARRSSRCASGWGCAPPSSGSCSASSARRPPSATWTGCGSSTRWRPCSARSGRGRRSSSSSTTSSGPTARRCSCCDTWSARRNRPTRCCSAPIARPSSSRATRCSS